MKVKIDKPIENLPIFVVVNSEKMLWEGYKQEINTVILNDTSTQEFIRVLNKTKIKSIKYCYDICIANDIEAIEGLRDLVEFLKKEGFSYYISPEQLEMYKQTISNYYNQPTKEAI